MKKIDISLTPKELALIWSVIGNCAATSSTLTALFNKLDSTLSSSVRDARRHVIVNGDTIRLVSKLDEALETILNLSPWATFSFKDKGLPRQVVYFEYPEHGTGKLVPRLIKVEDEDLGYIKGYEIDLKTNTMTWNFKSFVKKSIVGLIRNE